MATKKPDVADSWEEIDEERLPGTISILKNTSNSTGTTTKPTSRASTSGNAARLQDTLPQMLEEELRPKMIPRPMQILKRPQSSTGTDGKSPTDSKPKTQIKSLDQRKQEYAEARLRILGSAHDDEDAETKKVTPATASSTTANATNGFRINNANNNNNNSSNNNGVGSAAAGSAGVGVIGSTANSNANNAYRYHSPYRQQAPLGPFPPSLQNAPSQGLIASMYYPSMGNQNQHHPMHSAHGMHHPPSAFPHVPHHHLQHNNHPYQHQQHFGQHINPPTGNQHPYGGGRNGGNAPGGSGYFAKGGPPPYAEANGGVPLLGHAPPGVHHTHSIPYGGGGGGAGAGYGQTNSHGNLVGHAGANIGNNQHVLRLPAGPDGSQGFNVRR